MRGIFHILRAQFSPFAVFPHHDVALVVVGEFFRDLRVGGNCDALSLVVSLRAIAYAIANLRFVHANLGISTNVLSYFAPVCKV